MSSWRSSNVDEMVRVIFTEKGLLPMKERECWRVPSIVIFATVRCGLPLEGGAPHLDAVVRVMADDDGIVLGCPSGGAPQSLAWCSTL